MIWFVVLGALLFSVIMIVRIAIIYDTYFRFSVIDYNSLVESQGYPEIEEQIIVCVAENCYCDFMGMQINRGVNGIMLMTHQDGRLICEFDTDNVELIERFVQYAIYRYGEIYIQLDADLAEYFRVSRYIEIAEGLFEVKI